MKILDENQHGLRTCEIAKKTNQTIKCAFGILKLLARQGRVERHGNRYTTLWTLPGMMRMQPHVRRKPMLERKLGDRVSSLPRPTEN